MLSRKICRPKVVVRSLFWMICRGSRIGQPLTALARKRLLPDRHEPCHVHGLEIGQDLTPICSTVVPVNEPMGRGCPRWCWLGLEFGPSFEGSRLLAGCSVVEAKFALLDVIV